MRTAARATNISKPRLKSCWCGSWSPILGKHWSAPEEKFQWASALFLAKLKANSKRVVEKRGDYGLRVLRFHSKNGFHQTLDRLGHIPLPPYIKRADEPLDRERYQTVYAKQGSAVAAPTAGLHFTPEILQRVRARGIEIAELTLDVGLGTFEPVRTERLEDHKIHAESYDNSASPIAAIERAQTRTPADPGVGTTVVRTLEDAAEKAAGKASRCRQARPKRNFSLSRQTDSHCQSIADEFSPAAIELAGASRHFAGRENILRAYGHAVESEYRFYSYGDCMLIR